MVIGAKKKKLFYIYNVFTYLFIVLNFFSFFEGNHPPLSAAERLRVNQPSHLRDNSHSQGPGHSYPHGPRRDNNRELMDKSKSIPNLHMDNSFDGRMDQGMRPAQSVSALQQQSQRVPNHGAADYYNQPHSLDDSRSHDYENQPVRQADQSQGFPNTSQTQPPSMQYRPPGQPIPAPRASQNFERPQSQYYGQPERSDLANGRPRSEEITPERLQNWQNGSPHDSFDNRTPNYSNVRPQPNYANQGEIRKMDMGNQSKQPNFYENTYPRQQEPTPPFQQLKRPPSESGRPPTLPKPAIKPTQPSVQPAEIPRSDVDNRQTQPHFYNPQLREKAGYPNASSPNSYNTSPSSHYQNTSFHDGRADFKTKNGPVHDEYMQKHPDMPPPPHEMAPELPPPPNMDELQEEELPPLPPPPANDFRLEQKIREEQNRIYQQQQQQQQQQQGSDPSYSNLPPQNSRNQPYPGPNDRNSFPNSVGFQPQSSMGYQPPATSVSFSPQQPQSLPVQSSGYPANHDYQNINYPSRTGEQNQQSPPQNPYESYDPRKVPNSQQSNRPTIHHQIKDQRDAIVSPWQREEREKQQKQAEEGVNRMREREIASLEERPYRSPQEDERLRKLKLDHEFQRRLQEVQSKDEEDDSDDERFVSTLSYSRFFQ